MFPETMPDFSKLADELANQIISNRLENMKLRSDVSLLQADKNQLGQELTKTKAERDEAWTLQGRQRANIEQNHKDLDFLRRCNKGLQDNLAKEIDENERLREANKSTTVIRPSVKIEVSVNVPGQDELAKVVAEKVMECLADSFDFDYPE